MGNTSFMSFLQSLPYFIFNIPRRVKASDGRDAVSNRICTLLIYGPLYILHRLLIVYV